MALYIENLTGMESKLQISGIDKNGNRLDVASLDQIIILCRQDKMPIQINPDLSIQFSNHLGDIIGVSLKK